MEEGLGLRFGADLSAFPTTSTATEHESGGAEHNDQEETWQDDEEELPVISIELERLVGFKPSTRDEIDSIKKQLIEAMWMRYKSSNSSSSKNSGETKETDKPKESEGDEMEELPPDFDDQIKELLDSRVARFGSIHSQFLQETEGYQDSNSDSKHNPGPFLEITYPSRLLPPHASNDGNDENSLKYTAKLWSDIRSLSYALDDDHGESEEHTFWYHLSNHLEHTGRLLFWKHAMALELRDVLYRETLHKNHGLWIKEQRTAKLEQLYQVRETLVHRKEVAQDDFGKLESQKTIAIRRDMLLYDHAIKRKSKIGGGGDTNSDSLFGGGELSFPEEFELMGLMPKDSQLYEEEDWGGTLDDEDDFDYYNSDYSDGYSDKDDSDDDLSGFSGDEEDDGDDQVIHSIPPPLPEKSTTNDDDSDKDSSPARIPVVARELPDIEQTDSANILPTTSVPRPFLRRNKARRKKKARAQKKKELAEAKHKEEQEKRKEHEILLQAKHTTNELVLAQTLQEALEAKVKDVEELLENLQDEEWAAEEEAETKQKPQEQPQSKDSKDELSLLDQILAMILGALPMEPGGKDKERHFQYVREEHEFIVKGWKEYFGRLPSAHVPGALPESEEPLEETNEEDKASLAKTEQKSTTTTIGFKAPPTSHKLTKITSRKASLPSKAANTAMVVSVTPQEQRIALGIVDNEDGDWEDGDDE